MPSELLLGYPAEPRMLSETMVDAAQLLSELGDVVATPWRQLRVEGRAVWDTVAAAIDRADLAVFEVTHLNPNVCFELGYAIGSNKPISPLRDTSDTSARSTWDQLNRLNPWRPRHEFS